MWSLELQFNSSGSGGGSAPRSGVTHTSSSDEGGVVVGGWAPSIAVPDLPTPGAQSVRHARGHSPPGTKLAKSNPREGKRTVAPNLTLGDSWVEEAQARTCCSLGHRMDT